MLRLAASCTHRALLADHQRKGCPGAEPLARCCGSACPCRLFSGLPVILPPHRALRQPYHINGVRWTFGQCWVYEYTAYGAAKKKLSESKTLRPGRMLRDSTLVAWYRSLYAPRTGGAYDSHHRTAGIAG